MRRFAFAMCLVVGIQGCGRNGDAGPIDSRVLLANETQLEPPPPNAPPATLDSPDRSVLKATAHCVAKGGMIAGIGYETDEMGHPANEHGSRMYVFKLANGRMKILDTRQRGHRGYGGTPVSSAVPLALGAILNGSGTRLHVLVADSDGGLHLWRYNLEADAIENDADITDENVVDESKAVPVGMAMDRHDEYIIFLSTGNKIGSMGVVLLSTDGHGLAKYSFPADFRAKEGKMEPFHIASTCDGFQVSSERWCKTFRVERTVEVDGDVKFSIIHMQ